MMIKYYTAVYVKNFKQFKEVIRYIGGIMHKPEKELIDIWNEKQINHKNNICVGLMGGYGNKEYYESKNIRIVSFYYFNKNKDQAR